MTNRERLMLAVSGGRPDRVPVSIYQHSTVKDRGAREFAEFTLSFHEEFSPDYVKVMYDEVYDSPVNYQFASDPSVWGMLDHLDPRKAAFGRYLESLKIIRDAVDSDTPVICTVFTPLHIAVRLAWTRLKEDCRTDPEQVQKGLATISENWVAFIEVVREEAGIDGFFIGAFGGESRWFSETEYVRVAGEHDKKILAAVKGMPIVIVHAHGEHGAHFDLFKDYDCNALSWEDRSGGPSLKAARAMTSKCLVGGIDHHMAQHGNEGEVYSQARNAIDAMGGAGFVLAPGCTFLPGTLKANMLALKRAAMDAAESAGKGGRY